MDQLYSLIPMLLMIAALVYFMILRPQKKQKAEEEKMRSGTGVGDEIITIGGICGRIVSLSDKTMMIETGSDRVKLKFERSAMKINVSAMERDGK